MIPEKDKAIMSKFMQDFWKYVKETYILEDTDETWDKILVSVNDLAIKYRDPETKKIPPAIMQILVGWLGYLECEGCGKVREFRSKKKDELSNITRIAIGMGWYY